MTELNENLTPVDAPINSGSVVNSYDFNSKNDRNIINSYNLGTFSTDKITAGTIDASLITVTNISATNITTGTMSASLITGGTLSADRIGGGTVTANILTAGTISGTVVDLTNVNASNITVGTITGIKFRTNVAGSARVELEANQALIDIYDSGDDLVLRVDDNGTDVTFSAFDGRNVALDAAGGASVYCNDPLDMNSNDIKTVKVINFITTGNHGGNNSVYVKDNEVYAKDGSGNSTQLT